MPPMLARIGTGLGGLTVAALVLGLLVRSTGGNESIALLQIATAVSCGLIVILGGILAMARSASRVQSEGTGNRIDALEARLDVLAARPAEPVLLRTQESDRLVELASEVAMLQLLVEQLVEMMEQRGLEVDRSVVPPPGNQTDPARIALMLRQALKDNRVDLFVQPIVKLPNRHVQFFEAFSRIRTEKGETVLPSQYLPSVQEEDLGAALDSLLLFRSISLMRTLSTRKPNIRLFCNLSAQALEDQGFTRQLVEFLKDNAEIRNRLIFELSAAELSRLPAAAQQTLAALSAMGCPFSVDQVTSLSFDPARLAAINIKFVKISAETLLTAETAIARDEFATFLKRHDITLIATHLEQERDVVEILELGVGFGQGYLFGRPRPSSMLDAAPQQAA